jgi:murein DD-endopeptidase
MDFKVPVGTEVVSPRAGTVVRTNWNFTYNGNAVEVRFNDGTLARFLHLSDTRVQPGQTLAAGAVVGLSGNTGRSTAPHLHYELEKGGKTLDPAHYHGTRRRALTASDKARFDAERERLDAILGAGGV